VDPGQATLLVNEMSDHLPIYCWDRCAKRVLALAASGFQVLATVHAGTSSEFISNMRTPAIGATDAEIVALNTVVFIDITPEGARRISEIVHLSRNAGDGHLLARSIMR
jgi:hypothetical protein